MQFRILGSLEVTAADAQVEIRRRQERLLLAVLLLSPNRVVPTDRLADLIWPEGLPDQPGKTLRVYVSRLRAALGPSGPSLISHGQGYSLQVDPSHIDLHLFRARVAEARRVDPAPRRPLLIEALSLWRGPALADVASDEIRSELCAGLEEERLSALELRIESDLADGRYEALVPELTELVAQHPGRDKLVAAQMLALYWTGRQSDALNAFRQTKEWLADEFGLDPSPTLRQLEVAVLQETLHAPTTPPAAGRVPRQLPRPSANFVGRAVLMDELALRLRRRADHSVVCALNGMAGVGKTALAVRVADLIAADFPDGQLYVDLGGYGGARKSTLEALHSFLRELGDGDVPDDVAAAAGRFRSALAGKRVLLVLDNAADAEQVEPLIPGHTDCAVIVTSRNHLDSLPYSDSYQLQPMPTQEAADLLEQLAGHDRIRTEPDASASILLHCGGLPLAIQLAGKRLAARPAWPLSHFADRLADNHRRLDQLQVDHVAARAAFAGSLAQLDERDTAAAMAFVHCGLVDNTRVDDRLVAALLDRSRPDTEDALERLVDASLLTTGRPGSYHLHDLLWTFAREESERKLPLDDQIAALRRALGVFAEAAWTVTRARSPRSARLQWLADNRVVVAAAESADDAESWLTVNRSALLSLLARHDRIAHEQHILQVAVGLGLSHHWFAGRDWEGVLQVAGSALPAAIALKDRTAEGFLRNDLGIAHGQCGRPLNAVDQLRRSVALFGDHGLAEAEISALNNLSRILLLAGRPDESLEAATRSLDLAERLGDQHLRLGAHLVLGKLAGDQREHLEAAAQLAADLNDDWRLGTALLELARLELASDDLGSAIAKLEDSLSAYQRIGLRDGIAEVSALLAESRLRSGSPSAAVAAVAPGLAAAEAIDDRPRQARLLMVWSTALERLQEPVEARHRRLQADQLLASCRPH